jgi:hypothetical protein
MQCAMLADNCVMLRYALIRGCWWCFCFGSRLGQGQVGTRRRLRLWAFNDMAVV